MKALKIFGAILFIIVILAIGAGTYIKTALPDVGPATDIRIKGTPERVLRGKYLANHVTVCMDCHSKRDWNLYAGPMSKEGFGGGGEIFNQEMGFPGTFYARNITPYALAKWTDGEILRAVTTGVNKTGKALFPLMAFHRFGRMDEEDVYSIIAYLRTLAPVNKEIPESEVDFPVNILINTMPENAHFAKIPPVTDSLAYGGYLVNAAGCIDCHSQTDKGKIVPGTEFGGGMEFNQPSGIARSANITSDVHTGIGKWTKADFVNRFKVYSAVSNYTPVRLTKGSVNTPMPWTMYADMELSDLEAMYTYLKSLKPISNKVIPFGKQTMP